jgi:hypothetical protein
VVKSGREGMKGGRVEGSGGKGGGEMEWGGIGRRGRNGKRKSEGEGKEGKGRQGEAVGNGREGKGRGRVVGKGREVRR